MTSTYNDVFRMVNLRGGDDELVVDPEVDPPDGTEGDGGGPIVVRIRAGEISLETTSAPQLEAIFRSHGYLVDAARRSNLQRLTEALIQDRYIKPDTTLAWGDARVPLFEIADSQSFKQDYQVALNAWLLKKYSGEKDREFLENQLRVSGWLRAIAANRAAAPSLRAMLQRRVVVPRALRFDVTERRLKERPQTRPGQKPLSAPSTTAAYDSAEREIDIINTIVERIGDVLLARSVNQTASPPAMAIAGKRRRGLLTVIRELFLGYEPTTRSEPSSESDLLVLDDRLINEVRQGFGVEETQLFDGLLATLPASASLEVVLGTLSDRKSLAIERANTFFDRVWYDRYHPTLPPAILAPSAVDHGAVQALGWGDLIVARERLVDYEAREIAHIENVLPTEKKNRRHERRHTVEDLVETEVEETEEAERELETTDRHELQTESDTVVAEEFAIQTGINTSGRYGLTKVETSLDAGFKRSSSEAQRSTLNVAKEIVSKAAERTIRSVRQLRRRTATTEVVEINDHTLDNAPKEGQDAAAISGIYRWVEKVHQIELRHYGTRMMVEFSVPEPALSVLGMDRQVAVDVEEPKALTINASDITEGKYLSLARRYEAVGIAPPPDPVIRVGFAWASQSSEKIDENKAEDSVAQLVAIPESHYPIAGTVAVSAHPAEQQFFQARFQIGHEQVSRDGQASFKKSVSFSRDRPWPGGVPVSMTAHGHFDKTLSFNVVFVCRRRKAAFQQWQIKTFEAILAGYQKKLAEYKEAVAAARLSKEISERFESQPDLVNRRTEREELQKWSTKIMRRVPFELDAIVTEGAGADSHDEVDPVRADQQAPLVRFYQEAFEWDNMSYFFYPYFWGRRQAWTYRQSVRHNDFRFETFLRAGAARVIVPVTPGYEAKILFYLANPHLSETDRIKGPEDLAPTNEPPPTVEESVYNTLWLELMINKNEELALGSGFLEVTSGSDVVRTIDSAWQLSERDVGRELFIAGDRYEVAEIVDETTFRLTDPFVGASNPRAAYATGSVPFGPPWLVNLPTTLVVLDPNRSSVGI